MKTRKTLDIKDHYYVKLTSCPLSLEIAKGPHILYILLPSDGQNPKLGGIKGSGTKTNPK